MPWTNKQTIIRNTWGGWGWVSSVVAWTNISVDNTDPANPIVSSLSDRYKTTSTTSQTIVSTGTLTFTVASNLAYSPMQDVIIAFDSSNHMHGSVVSYSGTTLIVDIAQKTGSGTYSSWTINLDAVVAWGSGITRSINLISTNTTAWNSVTTDYTYICTATLTLTLPTAVGNGNMYTVKNTAWTTTISTTSAQTIDGSSSATINVPYVSVDLISDGSNWVII